MAMSIDRAVDSIMDLLEDDPPPTLSDDPSNEEIEATSVAATRKLVSHIVTGIIDEIREHATVSDITSGGDTTGEGAID